VRPAGCRTDGGTAPDDGPRPPDRLVWEGVAHHFGNRVLQHRLLTALWGRQWVDDGELTAAVYGHDTDHKEGALRKLTIDLTKSLAGFGVPFEVERVPRQGYALRQNPV
jgi:hypothetical protein